MKYRRKIFIFFIIFVIKSQMVESYGVEDFTYSCGVHTPKKGIITNYQPISLQVSDRVTHQLFSRVYAIFLKEYLNFSNVTFTDEEYPSDNQETQIFWTQHNLLQLKYAINIESWISSNMFSFMYPKLFNFGTITKEPGRFGWFIPKILIKDGDFPDLRPYTIFLNKSSSNYQQFVIDSVLLEKTDFLLEKNNIRNTYTSTKCLKSNSCATLIAPNFLDSKFVIEDIENLSLSVNVRWYGNNLQQVIKYLLKNLINNRNKKFLVFHWTPSEIIDTSIEYESITMPECNSYKINSNSFSNCRYDSIPMLKLGSNLVKNVKFIEVSTVAVEFESNDTKSLLMTYEDKMNKMFDTNFLQEYSVKNLSAVYNEIACEWMKKNMDVVEKWAPVGTFVWNEIIIGAMFPSNGSSKVYNGISTAAKMAEEAINNDENILKYYNLTVLIMNDTCRPAETLRTFINFYNIDSRSKNVIGIVGPTCSETVEPIAGLSKYFRMPVIAYSAEGSDFRNRELYPYLFRTIGENRQYVEIYLKLFKTMNWNRIGTLTEDGQKYSEYLSDMDTSLQEDGIKLLVNKKFPRSMSENLIIAHLADFRKSKIKIIIADINENVAEFVLCQALKQQMTNKYGYVWFFPVWIIKNWSINPEYIYKNRTSCTKEDLIESMEGQFSLSHISFGDNSTVIKENKTIEEWREIYNINCTRKELTPSDYAGFAYDAIWVYALAADSAIRKNPKFLTDIHSDNSTQLFTDLIKKTDFQGVSGRVKFNEGGSRNSKINILQWINGTFNIVGYFNPNVSDTLMNSQGLHMNESAIFWLRGKPDDGTEICSLGGLAKFLNTNCETAVVILTSFCFAIFVVIFSLGTFMLWKRKYNKKMERSEKYLKALGLDMDHPKISLERWEVSKDRIVLNRKLGEGAFGTVYGGEAQLDGTDWTAVAVKTLKVGSTKEDRVDFLSEAELMKRFEHANIIQLLGVSLNSEPIYTIMEFMLYGDLKTFLLSRRHLVNEKQTEDSEISAKRLTMMVLDVVKALIYLAEEKYVHRDLACRNCLVNAQRVVKIGDFGMARSMSENDYYKFNRKGMLPVRWMAPESLILGYFTPSSDIWSFGVLLYEIITFGSFPFQGMNNNQVLEHIKQGNTLQVPVGVKPQMEGLMKACWNQDHKKRPTAKDIYDFILDFPKVVTPILDLPLASVQMAETDSDQLELLPGLRKRSSSPQLENGLVKSAAINNLDIKNSSTNNLNMSYIQMNSLNLNVPRNNSLGNIPNGSSSSPYNPVEPLLRQDSEVSKSYSSLRRYVPMFGKNKSLSLDRDGAESKKSINTSAL